MTTVTVEAILTGKVGLPDDILQASEIQRGAELVAIAEAGKITLIDRKQALQERMKAVDHQMRSRLRQALEEGGEASVFAGLSLNEYLALSEEEEKALWDGLSEEAEREIKIDEHDIPTHFRSAGQRDGTRDTARRRSR